MPIATEKDHDQKWMREHESNYDDNFRCGECGGRLLFCYGGVFGYKEYILRCVENIEHKGLSKKFELSPANTPGFTLWDAGKRRRMKLEQQNPAALALRKYEGLISLTKEQAKEIVLTLWPKANDIELYKAMNICASYGLNPLMKHLFMIPFKDTDSGKTELVCVLSIDANRLIASRKHAYSYIDDTPRKMTVEEEKKIYGNIDNNKFRAITKLRDSTTGAEASGYGEFPLEGRVHGGDKGNSAANMAFIRSERNALKKRYPMDMPSADIPVVDENYIEGETVEILPTENGKMDEVQNEPATLTKIEKSEEIGSEPANEIDPKNHINLTELKMSLEELKRKVPKTWADDKVLESMKKTYGATGKTPIEAARTLNVNAAKHFLNTISDALAMA